MVDSVIFNHLYQVLRTINTIQPIKREEYDWQHQSADIGSKRLSTTPVYQIIYLLAKLIIL
mgnify:CR=1